MPQASTIRLKLASLLLVATPLVLASRIHAQMGRGGGAHSAMPSPSDRMNPVHPAPNKEHLQQWMDRHSEMPLAQQQKALESEPGFHDLPPETQQRLRNRLTELNNMPPEQRRRLLERNEAIANLPMAQRQQLRSATSQFRSLPDDRRRLVARAFRDLREMPEPQRQAILSSDRFRTQFSDQERDTLSSLLAVEPYIPVKKSGDNSDYGR